MLPRECNQTCEINGYEIVFKTRVLINAWAIGRDPAYWAEAERFYPERFLNNCLLGYWKRFLPYNQAYCWQYLPNGTKQENLDMTEVFGLSVKRKDDLILVPIAYLVSTIV